MVKPDRRNQVEHILEVLHNTEGLQNQREQEGLQTEVAQFERTDLNTKTDEGVVLFKVIL